MTMLETTEQSIFKTRGPLDPVNDSAIYVPRPELAQLLRAAQATTVDAYLAILSSRQTGKSTLLYQLRHCLRPRGLGVALIDLAVVRDQPEDHLYSYVAGELRSELSPNLPRGADKKETAAPPPTNPIEFRHYLLDLARQDCVRRASSCSWMRWRRCPKNIRTRFLALCATFFPAGATKTKSRSRNNYLSSAGRANCIA
jgi:hypothetical protein